MCCQMRPDVPELLRISSAQQGLQSLAGWGRRGRQGEGGLLYSFREVLQKTCLLLCVTSLFLYQVPKEEGPLCVNLSAMRLMVKLGTRETHLAFTQQRREVPSRSFLAHDNWRLNFVKSADLDEIKLAFEGHRWLSGALSCAW